MLRYLVIRDFALIESLELKFESGLNVITGETGSGKSLLLSALGLLAGAKASANFVRAGRQAAWVEGAFELAAAETQFVQNVLGDTGIEVEPYTDLILRREIASSGRSRIFVNDRLVTIGALRSLRPILANIQSQGEQLSLVESETQLMILDAFARANGMRSQVASFYEEWTAAESLSVNLAERIKQKVSREDFLRFQLAEIEAVSPEIGEDDRLMAERSAAANAEKIRTLTSQSYNELFDSDDSALNKLAVVERELSQLSALDERVRPWADEFTQSIRVLEDVSDSLRNYAATFEVSEGRLDEIETRLAQLERLKRKHATDLDGLLQIQSDILEELNSTETLEFERAELVEKTKVLWKSYLESAVQLSLRRKAEARGFAELVEKNLESVALEQCRFEVRISTSPCGMPDGGADIELEISDQVSDNCSANGIDSVDFFFSANPGEPVKRLSDVASGGELSRLFLVLHTLGRETEESGLASGTVVFDEIDVGIGGRVAEAVGRRLKDLARRQQVLCVTHQPQIARFADIHFVVYKQSDDDRTRTLVAEVHGDERVRELVRMVGGADDVENRRVVDLIFQTDESTSRKKKRRGV